MATRPVSIKVIKKVETPIGDHIHTLEESGTLDTSVPTDEAIIKELSKAKSIFFTSDIPVILETKGVMTEQDGEISVMYETRLEESVPTIVSYSFKKANRNVLTVKKSSFAENIFFYETKRKTQWLGDVSKAVDGGSICFTKSLKNYISYDAGGYIDLEYYIEINGELFEYNKEFFIVEPIK